MCLNIIECTFPSKFIIYPDRSTQQSYTFPKRYNHPSGYLWDTEWNTMLYHDYKAFVLRNNVSDAVSHSVVYKIKFKWKLISFVSCYSIYISYALCDGIENRKFCFIFEIHIFFHFIKWNLYSKIQTNGDS